MEAFQQRVVTELDELEKKLNGLESFFNLEVFSKLPMEDQVLLQVQAVYMNSYADILAQRIARFNLTNQE